VSFELLREAVLDDPSLQRRLRGLDDWPAFAAEALAAAAERGIALTPGELDDARRAADLASRIGSRPST